MELKVIKDEKTKTTIGIKLYSDAVTEEEFFIMEFPKKFLQKKADITVISKKIVFTDFISNENYAFNLNPDDAEIIKEYIESNDSIGHIKTELGFARKLIIMFECDRIFQKYSPVQN